MGADVGLAVGASIIFAVRAAVVLAVGAAVGLAVEAAVGLAMGAAAGFPPPTVGRWTDVWLTDGQTNGRLIDEQTNG